MKLLLLNDAWEVLVPSDHQEFRGGGLPQSILNQELVLIKERSHLLGMYDEILCITEF